MLLTSRVEFGYVLGFVTNRANDIKKFKKLNIVNIISK